MRVATVEVRESRMTVGRHFVSPTSATGDHGLKLRVGANVLVNHGCTFNDITIAPIQIGANV